MKERFRHGKAPIPISCLLLMAVVTSELYAWYDKTHVFIILESVELLKRIDKGRTTPLYEEIYLPAFLKEMARGGSDEDWYPSVRGKDRAFRHYYDPDAPPGKQGCPFYYHYYLWREFEGADVKPPAGDFYEGTLEWATKEVTGNLFNWPGAISAYDYTQSSKEEAYFRLGHVGHLLGDMADSDHTQNIPHPGSGWIFPDKLEDALGEKALKKVDELLVKKGASSLARASTEMAIKLVYLHLRGNVNRTTAYERLIEDYVDLSLVKDYMSEEDIREKLTKSHMMNPPRPPISGNMIRKYTSVDDHFNTVARKSKNAVNNTDFALPLGLVDLYKIVQTKVSEWANRATLIATLLPGRLTAGTAAALKTVDVALWVFEEPIYAIPTIPLNDDKEKARFLNLAWPLIKETVETSAGLLEHFHDIVNHPPYVEKVTITQEEKGRYSAGWTDRTGMKQVEWEEKHQGVKSQKKKDYYVVTSREMEVGETSPFVCDKPSIVRITFGPSADPVREKIVASGPSPDYVKEKIDPNSVWVSIGGELIRGSMVDGNIWQGDYFPKLPDEEDEKEYTIEINAKDLHHHFERQGLPEYGYELDSAPGSPAKASFIPPHSWEGYEPGPDRNHKIRVKREDEEEKEEEEETEEPEQRRDLPPFQPIKERYLIWINKCGTGPGGRIYVGTEEQFKTPKRCRDEWLFGMSQEYLKKVQIGGPFGSLEEAINAACGMISEPGYIKIPGWGMVPGAKYGGTFHFIDGDLEKHCMKK